MTYAFTIDRGQGPEVLLYGPFTDEAGTCWPVDVLDRSNDQQLAALGVVRTLVVVPTADLRAAKVEAVKAEAGRRILAIMPEVQQRNALALGMEMVTTHGPDPADWPVEERAIHTAVMVKWGQIKALRTASNAIEAAIPAQDREAIEAFDVAAQDWPA